MEPLIYGISLSDWFKYHPPQSDERKGRHDRVNNAAMSLARKTSSADWDVIVSEKVGEILGVLGTTLPEQKISEWILELKETLIQASDLDEQLMLIQQIRMMANQAITFSDII